MCVLCWTSAGVKVVGQIHEPGFLEGGDFFPLGQDLSMVRLMPLHIRCNANFAYHIIYIECQHVITRQEELQILEALAHD